MHRGDEGSIPSGSTGSFAGRRLVSGKVGVVADQTAPVGEFLVRWSRSAGEYVATSPAMPGVSGHSREPLLALASLIRKHRELEQAGSTSGV